MAGVFFWLLWAGGVGPAYRSNRRHNMGVFRSAFEALAWPFEIGWSIAQNFYENEDWEK
jgi:hypothetical protein